MSHTLTDHCCKSAAAKWNTEIKSRHEKLLVALFGPKSQVSKIAHVEIFFPLDVTRKDM